ncbi:hypothetical protein Q0Z83_108480 [Actinoplanes sichuanensis]|uniref:DUF4132 domain-containing protein n=1 Tax=Actinoplanes sichuanensis TaxID=512349 RepID=A0ABW4AL09_9ACTN|nr:DUF4132 domain-containing protein [Actinoplanes sichuanensis]BEL12657.1 hypothetical protein Q0Z83_108480 [Actinoplanes sichuanensis]
MSFELPEPWPTRLHPRRGGAGVRPVEPEPRAREVVDGQMRQLPGFVPGVIASEFTEPELREAATAWSAGDPTAPPVGAAVAAFAVRLLDWQEHVRYPWFADLWLAERGLRFAAEAAVELFSLILVAEGDRPPRRAIRRDGTETMGVRRRRPGDEQRTLALAFDPDLQVLLRVRAALAAAPDDLHAEIVDALAAYREHGPPRSGPPGQGPPGQRLPGRGFSERGLGAGGLQVRCATSVLVPSRVDWVEHDWAEALAEPGFNRAAMLLAAISTPEQAAAARGASGSLTVGWPGLNATVVDGLGPAAASGLLLDWFDRLPPTRTEPRRDLLALLAVLPGEETMRGLIDRLDQRHVREALTEAATRFPEPALRLLSAPSGKPQVTDLLSARVRADPSLAERVATTLPTAQAARIRACLSAAATVAPAPPEALPPLLADPPWRRRRKGPPVVLDLTAPEPPTTVEWKPGERAEWLSTPLDRPDDPVSAAGLGDRFVGAGRDTSAGAASADTKDWAGSAGTKDWAGVAGRLERGEVVGWREAAEFFVAGPEEVARPLLAEWKPVPEPGCEPWMRRIVARFEADALPLLRRLAFHDSMLSGPLMLPFVSPDIPWRMQVRLHDRGRTGQAARAWLDRQPGSAASRLMPRAFGPDGTARRSAQHTLVYMVATGHTEILREVADSYGPETRAAVEELVTIDPLAILPTRLPAIPKWFDPALLPPVRLRRPRPPATRSPEVVALTSSGSPRVASDVEGWDERDLVLPTERLGRPLPTERPGRASTTPQVASDAEGMAAVGDERDLVLPTESLRDLAMVFALHKPLEPYAGVEVVRAACEPEDLARFAWGLFEAWLAAGADGRQGWALDALGLVGDDEVVRRLTPLIMGWPGQSGHARAVTGLGVLADIGTEVALVHLHRIAERTRYAGLRSAAQRQIDQVAARMGLSTERLADRLVPDFGLDGDGGLTLDYGPRSFAVRFDEELKPCVVDSGGKVLKNLPKPGVRDDAELAPAAYQRFTVLKKDVRTVAADQIRRLERAMVTGRRWPEAEFRRFLIEHPLLRHPARRLLWGRFDASGVLVGAFRVAEDGTFADEHDEETRIAAGQVVGVVHPIDLGRTLPRWSEVFADYRIMQPFAQLGRETGTLTGEEAATGRLVRFEGLRVPTGAVLGLENRGWRRERPMDGGVQVQITVSPVGGVQFVLDLDPGIAVGAVDVFPEQTLGAVGFGVREAARNEVAVSEVIRDLEALTSTR